MLLAVDRRAWLQQRGGRGSWRHQSASAQGCTYPAVLEIASHSCAFSYVRIAHLPKAKLPTSILPLAFLSFHPYMQVPHALENLRTKILLA